MRGVTCARTSSKTSLRGRVAHARDAQARARRGERPGEPEVLGVGRDDLVAGPEPEPGDDDVHRLRRRLGQRDVLDGGTGDLLGEQRPNALARARASRRSTPARRGRAPPPTRAGPPSRRASPAPAGRTCRRSGRRCRSQHRERARAPRARSRDLDLDRCVIGEQDARRATRRSSGQRRTARTPARRARARGRSRARRCENPHSGPSGRAACASARRDVEVAGEDDDVVRAARATIDEPGAHAAAPRRRSRWSADSSCSAGSRRGACGRRGARGAPPGTMRRSFAQASRATRAEPEPARLRAPKAARVQRQHAACRARAARRRRRIAFALPGERRAEEPVVRLGEHAAEPGA